MRLALAAAAIACSACTLFDERPTLELVVPERVGRETMFIELRAAAGADIVLSVDGRDLGGRFSPGRIELATAELHDGWHVLSGRVVNVPYEERETRARFLLDREAPRVAFDPPPGELVSTTPVIVRVDVRDPLPFEVELRVTGGETSPIEATVSRLDDGTWEIVPEETLEHLPELAVEVSARDAAGNEGSARASYRAPTLYATVMVAKWSYYGVHGGVVPLDVVSSYEHPTSLTLLADGSPAGAFELEGQQVRYDWDSSALPDGTYALTVSAPGWRGTGPAATITLDNTPPSGLRCVVPPELAGGLSVHSGVRVVADEPVVWGDASATADADGVPVSVSGGTDASGVKWCAGSAAAPYTLRFHFPAGSVEDRVGNASGALECAFEVPRWFHPRGAGALATEGVPWTASVAAVRVDPGSSYCAAPSAEIAWIEAAGPRAGKLVLEREMLNMTTGSTATAVRLGLYDAVAWTERDGDGPALVYFRERPETLPVGPLNADATRDATDLALDTKWPPQTLAWSEATAEGGRQIRVRDFRSGATVMPPASADPGADARSPSVDGSVVAFVQRTAGGPAQLHVKAPSSADPSGWGSIGSGVLNRDPLSDAASPALVANFGTYVAWEEDGDVLVRTWDYEASDWSEPVVLDADPARPARSPRVAGGLGYGDDWIVFVEETPSGDEIRARHLDGSAWVLVEEPVNAGALGPVRSLEAYPAPPLGVIWLDDAGAVRVRVSNE